MIRALGRALPAGAGGLDELGHVERLGRGPLGATGEGEQLGEEPGEPLGLVLGGGELALDLGVAALERRGLETKAQARERRAQLVRGVRDEVALVAKRGRHASGHVVERGGHLPLLGGALHACAGVEVAVRNAPRRAGQAAQGLGERAGEEPRHHQAEQQRHGAHAHEREHVVALLGLHGVDALRHPHRARRAAVHRHGDGGEEEVLVQQVAVALALGRVGHWSALLDLRAGAVAIAARGLAGRVRQEPPARVDHDHAPAEAVRRALHQPLELAAVAEPAGGAGGDQLRLAPGVVLDLGVHALRQVQRERHLERHDHEHEHVREREDEPRAEAHSSSAAAKRKPTPRTVWMKRGF